MLREPRQFARDLRKTPTSAECGGASSFPSPLWGGLGWGCFRHASRIQSLHPHLRTPPHKGEEGLGRVRFCALTPSPLAPLPHGRGGKRHVMPTLVIANKCYSSWSLRPWLLMKQLGIPFDEIVIPLDLPEHEGADARSTRRPARCRSWSTVTSPCGRALPSWNMSASAFGAGLAVGPQAPAPWRARSRPRCMRAFPLCAPPVR